MPTSTRLSAEHGFERVDWRDLGPQFIEDWGRTPSGAFDPEHLTVYGKSGGGKTHFVQTVLQQRAAARGSHVVMVVTKRSDKTVAAMDWPVINRWPPEYGDEQVILWARARGLSVTHLVPQRKVVREFMDSMWQPGANTIVYWDELTYIEKNLKLKNEIETFYREGRTNGITNVASMQRPAYVSRLAHSEAGWTVGFPPKDHDDRDRVAEVFGDRARYRIALDDLDRWSYEFLIKHDRSGQTFISALPAPRSRRSAGRAGSVRSRTSEH